MIFIEKENNLTFFSVQLLKFMAICPSSCALTAPHAVADFWLKNSRCTAFLLHIERPLITALMVGPNVKSVKNFSFS